jgi:hypothetical protein
MLRCSMWTSFEFYYLFCVRTIGFVGVRTIKKGFCLRTLATSWVLIDAVMFECNARQRESEWECGSSMGG